LQTQASTSGDIGTIAKAALYLMGDTTQKDAVQAGVQSSSVWVKVACAGALGIVDKDDASVTSAIIPEVKWIEPDNMGGATDNGKGMYAVHILEIVAFDRRGWVSEGNGEGPVTFYGETAGGTGGSSGAGGASGAGRDLGRGGLHGRDGKRGASGTGGTSGGGGSTVNRDGGTMLRPAQAGLWAVAAALAAVARRARVVHLGRGSIRRRRKHGQRRPESWRRAVARLRRRGRLGRWRQWCRWLIWPRRRGRSAAAKASDGCKCNLGGRPDVPALMFPAAAGLALLLVRRRRRTR
jgi:hypothetical protein